MPSDQTQDKRNWWDRISSVLLKGNSERSWRGRRWVF